VSREGGGAAWFTVRLTSQPKPDVTIPVASSNAAEGVAAPASLTFTAADWNVPQTVTVTGQDDFMVDGNVAYSIRVEPADSKDPNYTGMDAADVAVTNDDNDVTRIHVT